MNELSLKNIARASVSFDDFQQRAAHATEQPIKFLKEQQANAKMYLIAQNSQTFNVFHERMIKE